MTKMINDGRACAQAINEMLNTRHRTMPVMEGEVQHLANVLIFGHYDSRGGACLVQNPSIIDAMQRYNVEMGWEQHDNSAYEDLQAGSCGHIEIVVIGKELPPGGDILHGYAEKGEGYILYQVESRWQSPRINKGEWNEWEKTQEAILRHLSVEEEAHHDEIRINIKATIKGEDIKYGTPEYRGDGEKLTKAYREIEKLQQEYLVGLAPNLPPRNDILSTEYRLTVWECGEDACGLCLL